MTDDNAMLTISLQNGIIDFIDLIIEFVEYFSFSIC